MARKYLEGLGLRFLEANWSCKTGEIDLIMEDGDTRVMVEVRLRRPTFYGEGVDTVAYQKQRKLLRTAQWYQQERDFWGNVRFDVVSICQRENMEPAIEHIEHAFDFTG